MSERPSVLITGPVNGLDDYVEAATEAGWNAVAFPLVAIEPNDVELVDSIDGLPGYVAVTSANALPALERAVRSLPELLSVPLAAVGARSAEAARDLGFKVGFDDAHDGKSLAAALVEHCRAGTSVLWPRGELAHEFGEALKDGGLDVLDVVVYATVTVPHDVPPPATDAVFFASPSAVAAWHADAGWPTPARAIAIGETTLAAVAEAASLAGASHEALREPEPDSLATRLRALIAEADDGDDPSEAG